jgi:spore germination protein KB
VNIEKGKISALQLSFLITGYIEGAVYAVSFAVNLSKHDTWLTVLSGLSIVVPFVYICALLIKIFPGLNLARIHNVVYGRYLGTAVSLYYLCFFLLLLSLTAKDIGDIYNTFFIQDTPEEVILIAFIGVCAYAAWNCIESLARITPFIVTIVSLTIIATTIMLLPKMDFANFLPVGELPLINFIHATQIVTEVTFGLILPISLSIAFTANKPRQAGRAMILGLLAGVFFFMIIVVRNTAVLGNTEALLFSPSFQTSRLINIGFLSRLDILFAVGHTFGQFLICSIYFYITVLLLSQILGLSTYLPLIFPLGCIAVVLGMTLYPSITAHFQSTQNVEIVIFFPAMFVFPPLTLLISKIRNLPKEEGNKK